jgi:hypothetical protein
MSIWLVQLALLVYLPPRKPITFTGGVAALNHLANVALRDGTGLETGS